MNTREKIEKRFKELADQLLSIKSMARMHGPDSIDSGKWYGWCVSAMHLLKLAFGESSVHFTEFEKIYDPNVGGFTVDVMEWLNGIFLAAKVDFEGGYATTIEAAVAGEIFADFVALAKVALNQKQKDVAAVLACAALEDTLKRLASMNGLDIEGKDLQEVINALKSKGLVSGVEKKILDPMRSIRNDALHADWDNISEMHVGSVISTVEQLLLFHFSPP